MSCRLIDIVAAVLLLCVWGADAYNNGVAREPYMGWTTWCTNGKGASSLIPCENDYCEESEIESVIDSMVKNGLDKLGYRWILLDDWYDSR